MDLPSVTTSVDGTIPIEALLFQGEDLLASQDGVGLYVGNDKLPSHQCGTSHLSSHRLFYIDSPHPTRRSFSLNLSLVKKTEYYAGLFTSSPKASLFLSSDSSDDLSPWTCSLCGFRNPPGFSAVCGLCGVPVPTPVQNLVPKSRSSNACTMCTFINHPSLATCEMCDSPLKRDGDGPSTTSSLLIKLSFRRGGDKTFYADLKRALMTKAWQSLMTPHLEPPQASLGTSSGISHILSLNQSSQSTSNVSLSLALQDLQALMVKAKHMVNLADDLSSRLSAVESTTNNNGDFPEGTSSLLSDISNLAISKPPSLESTPITLEMIKNRDEARWLKELAVELSSVLHGIQVKKSDSDTSNPDLLPLDRLWVSWNRARGVSLIPPSTFLDVLPHLESITNMRIRIIGQSSIKVLYTPHFSLPSISQRISQILPQPLTPTSFGTSERITISLSQLLLSEVEMSDGTPICRDDWESAIHVGVGGGVLETKYYPNVFVDYVWDGHSE
ncbi:hypothetical protein E1B28_011173 [Marasmius oreades]|uniref:Vacuolar protein-sorting-associated protein 36 n=1 Tax=Marasmius oreades TaxID=181124 RepID=A0A9P7UPP3_9AGAR|nr:uncharacterized protein E1B28_011173 [Marasmius oreades]KAG7089493.1 hypothetical protein E1B28_011173 [Marasmius oreades]